MQFVCLPGACCLRGSSGQASSTRVPLRSCGMLCHCCTTTCMPWLQTCQSLRASTCSSKCTMSFMLFDKAVGIARSYGVCRHRTKQLLRSTTRASNTPSTTSGCTFLITLPCTAIKTPGAWKPNTRGTRSTLPRPCSACGKTGLDRSVCRLQPGCCTAPWRI